MFCNEHESADISLGSCFHYPWIYTQKYVSNAGSYGSSILNFLRSFHRGCTNFLFLLKEHKRSLFSVSSSTLIITCLFKNSHSRICEIIFHCGFGLPFPDGSRVEHLFMGLLTICLLWERSIQFLCPFFKWIFSLLSRLSLFWVLTLIRHVT